jgi:hypothetical protein
LLCGSINVRERPWASKRQPIDYKRCCTDRLNAHPESDRLLRCREMTQWVDVVEKGLVIFGEQ